MGISPRKNLMDEFFNLDGWTENTFTTTTSQNLTHLTSSGGGIALLAVEVAPTAGASGSLSNGDYVDLRVGLTTPNVKSHPLSQLLTTSAYPTNLFSVGGSSIGTTSIVDSSLLSLFGWSRALTNAKLILMPANTTLNVRLSSVNFVSNVTVISKLIPFPTTTPISMWSVGSWNSNFLFGLDSVDGLNLSQLDTGVLTPNILPGFWIMSSACRYNAESSVTKTQTVTINRVGAGVTSSPFRIRTRTTAAETGTNVVRTAQLHIMEHHEVNRVILDPVISTTHESYLSAIHIPYKALNSLL